ncbi:MAG: molecular chaperone TorD family protein [Chloroflexi bacterium]|nr:molecular chaperone TorD family protein [Chloroflexota bacterium]
MPSESLIDSTITVRADLYHALAEALADPPEWLASPGRDWPLFDAAVRLAPSSETARHAVEPLAEVRAESLAARRKRYAVLFAGPGRPRFWLYESAHLSRRLLGPESFAVQRLYRAAGLETASAELPDHASVELAFLAHLAENVETTGPVVSTEMERQFIERHAGRWLPDLGRALARTGDEVYAPIGQLLAEWLEESVGRRGSGDVGRLARHPPHTRHHASRVTRLPVVSPADACNLCGFCAQVCPTRAIVIRESEGETALILSAPACAGCGKCERACESGALKMKRPSEEREPSQGWNVLRKSPRAVCRACGAPTVSRAELDYVAAQIGRPAWLEYCSDCRLNHVETLHTRSLPEIGL